MHYPKEKGQTTIYKTLHIKLMTEQPHLKPGVNAGEVGSSSCSTCDICRGTLVTNPVISHE